MTSAQVLRLVGVYDAEGTLRGELSYWVGARLGRAHCSLCDLTHGTFRERSDWKDCRDELPVPFETYHRDDQPTAVRDVAEGSLPVVVAETTVGMILLLGPEELQACGGSLSAFRSALDAAVLRSGLSLS
jgi:hypothetical protein